MPIASITRIYISLRSTSPGKDVPLFQTTRSILKDESGATAIEYGLIAALLAFTTLGLNLTNIFTTISNSFG
ncbi:MAG: Flp family type IVb pilin [Hyphomicrobiales bacterium]|nr:Flp family type IVb pilin [Hyphomicrobiales bacterium]MCP4999881.1 Flp family type IVb pilin [Hyphomicrobiales bacterium]